MDERLAPSKSPSPYSRRNLRELTRRARLLATFEWRFRKSKSAAAKCFTYQVNFKEQCQEEMSVKKKSLLATLATHSNWLLWCKPFCFLIYLFFPGTKSPSVSLSLTSFPLNTHLPFKCNTSPMSPRHESPEGLILRH